MDSHISRDAAHRKFIGVAAMNFGAGTYRNKYESESTHQARGGTDRHDGDRHASRGFGRAIAATLSAVGADVVGVARSGAQLDQLRDELRDTFTPFTADATDSTAAGLSFVSVYRG
jgi:hypothetical protein